MSVKGAIEADKARIENAIKEAEVATSGEIIVAFARCAGRYERETAALAFAGSLVVLAIVWLLGQRIGRSEWTDQPYLQLGLPWVLLILVGAFAASYATVVAVPGIAMLLVRKRRRLRAAEEMAIIAFHDLHVANTRAHTGVLLFIAQAERAVVVLGDGPISQHIEESQWQGIRDQIVSAIQARQPAEGIVSAVRQSGELLTKHFPRDSQDKDELPNSIYFL